MASETDEIYSWHSALAGSLLFIVYGLVLILGEIPPEWKLQGLVTFLYGIFFVFGLLLPSIGFGVGWVRGFPRWSFPYLGMMLFLATYLQRVSTPGLRIGTLEFFGDEAWGWRAWIPCLAATLIALSVTRFSSAPLRGLLRRVWEDWTLLSFAMFGCLPLLAIFGFEEIEYLYSLPFMLLLSILLLLTAVIYLHARLFWQRVLSLLLGTLLFVGTVALVPSLYWAEQGWVDFLRVALAVLVVLVLFFSPALLGLLRWIRFRMLQRPMA
jgi:hypothetical protein